jgi:DNA-binding transcriptional LysR family regulator
MTENYDVICIVRAMRAMRAMRALFETRLYCSLNAGEVIVSLDLNLLPILFAVYETRSVGDAAERLGMSQPGLSAALKRARAALGDPLFLRTAHGMEPTSRTRSLIEPIRSILSTIDTKVTVAPNFSPSEFSDEFCIALSDAGESIYLPLLMRCMKEKAPKASTRSVSYKLRQLVNAMEEGEVDLAIGCCPQLESDDMFQQVVRENAFTCIMRVDHPLRGKQITLEQYKTLGHAVTEDGRSQDGLEVFLKSKNIRRKVVVRISHFMTIHAVVAETDLIVTVPQVIAALMVKRGGVKTMDTAFELPTYQTKVYWHRGAHHDPKNQWLRRTLAEVIRKEPGWIIP